MTDEPLLVEIPGTAPAPYIKVIGVGNGGGNAVAHMARLGIPEANLLVCNTDSKQLADSPVPDQLQLGPGLGAGGDPKIGRKLAEESIDAIDKALDDGTKMVFITTGMGGGTGTGASPVVAREAKKRGILTVGVVTIPFLFELSKKIDKALDGIEVLAKEVDSLLVINNERLREIYPELSVLNAFRKADDVLAVAVKSIVEIITMHGIINLDFHDVRTILEGSGTAIISTGYGSGEGRVKAAIDDALRSPLLHNTDVFRSTRFLMCISFNPDEAQSLQMAEYNEVSQFMAQFDPDVVETKWGLETNSELGNRVKVTILASGFGSYLLDNECSEESAEDDDKKWENKRRRERIYGTSDGTNARKYLYIYEFGSDDLDDDLVSEMVDTTPTYTRSKDQLAEIQRMARANAGIRHIDLSESPFTSDAPAADDAGTIDFSND